MRAIRLIKHEVIPKCGSLEVWSPDGAPSGYFYSDDIPGRPLRLYRVDAQTALEAAKAIARTERERLGYFKG